MKNHNNNLPGGMIMTLIVLVNAIVMMRGLTQNNSWYPWLFITIPLLVVSLIGVIQKRTLSEYPVIGHLQLLLQKVFPPNQQRVINKDETPEKNGLNKVSLSIKERINLNNQIN